MAIIAVATTTINEPKLLLDYASAAQAHQEQSGDTIFFTVAGDRKTPSEVLEFCNNIEEKYGIEIEYLSPTEQIKIVDSARSFSSSIRWDCIQRRNFAGLRSLEKGADFLIYIDDDNLITDSSYFKRHLDAFRQPIPTAVSTESGYFNIMGSAFGKGISTRTFPRGYPFAIRGTDFKVTHITDENSGIAANAGLWIEEADIDAVTRISNRPYVEGYSQTNYLKLAKGIWTPLNSQNTAFLSKYMAGYFLSDQVGRYDDIYAGYVFQKLINFFNHTVSYGEPIVRQERNEHDLLVDLEQEIKGIENLDFVLGFIRDLPMEGETPLEAMRNLMDNWEFALIDLPRKHPAEAHLRFLLHGYLLWIETLSRN